MITRGQGTASYTDIDEIVPEENPESHEITVPTAAGASVAINTISGNTINITMQAAADNDYWLKSYNGKGDLGSNITSISQDEETVTFVVKGSTQDKTTASKTAEIVFAMLHASKEVRSDEDNADKRDGTSKTALDNMVTSMGEGVVTGEITYVIPMWDNTGTEVTTAQLEKANGVDFTLDYPSADVKANKDNYSIRVYHYSYTDTAWSRVPDAQVELGTDNITVKNYKDFSPFVSLAIPATLKLTYKPGAGTGSEVVRNYVEGETVTVPNPEKDEDFSYHGPAEKPNFKCWINENDNTKTYYPGQTITMSDNLTLTAEWTTEVTITYLPGETDGSGTIEGSMKPKTAAVGTNVTLDDNNFEEGNGFNYDNHDFLGWKDQKGNGYANRGTIENIQENLELTAQWKRSKYTVTYNGNGGGDPTDPEKKVQTVDVDKPVTFKENMFTVPY